MVSARRTYIDLLARPFIKLANNRAGNDGDQVTGGYFFYDVNAKLNHIINPNNLIYFSAYLGDDKFYVDQKYQFIGQGNQNFVEESNGGLKWGNKIMALRWNHKFGPKLFSNTTVNYSDYRFTTGFGYEVYPEADKNNPTENFSFEIPFWNYRLGWKYQFLLLSCS